MPMGDDQDKAEKDDSPRLRVEDAPSISSEQLSSGARETVKLSPRAEHAAQHFNTESISPKILVNTLRLIEFLTVFTMGSVIYLTYVYPTDGFAPQYFVTSAFAALATIVAIHATRGYEISALRGNFSQWGRILGAWASVFALLSVLAFFLRVAEDFSRVWFGVWPFCLRSN